jgi:hypothetical protein
LGHAEKVCIVLFLVIAFGLGYFIDHQPAHEFTLDHPETVCVGLVDKNGAESGPQCFTYIGAKEAVGYVIYMNPTGHP